MEQQEKLTVLLIEPACYPKTIESEPGLEALQKAVGGWIEAVYPWEDKAAIIVNVSTSSCIGHTSSQQVHHRGSWLGDFLAASCFRAFSAFRTSLSGMGIAIR